MPHDPDPPPAKKFKPGKGNAPLPLDVQRKHLPIYQAKSQLINQLRQLHSAVLIGETGSGKTTQIPQYLYEAGIGRQGVVAVTQPRRVAAISLAGRVAEEKKTQLGKLVIIMSATMDVDLFSQYFNKAPVLYLEGRQHPIQVYYTKQPQSDYLQAALVSIFQIHQEAPPSHDILVFMTGQEEIEALARTCRDISKHLPESCGPMTVVPLYAALPPAQQLRVFQSPPKGCRKVILSTNIAETSITISGIKYVIDTGMVKAKKYNPDSGLEVLAVQRVSKAQAWQRAGRAGREDSGFCYRLYTEEEFDNFANMTLPEIQRCNLSSVMLQLLALRIPDVLNFDFMSKPSSVIDGLQSHYYMGGQALVRDCFALCWFLSLLGPQLATPARAHYCLAFSHFSDAHMQSDLCKAHKVMRRAEFGQKAISTAIEQLDLLGAIERKDDQVTLTPLGKKMASFPLEPRFAKTILLSPDFSCTEEVLTIVSILSVDSVLYNPPARREEVQAVRRKFISSEGDHMTLLNIYRAFKNVSGNKEWCRENFVNSRNMGLVAEVRSQLREICIKLGITLESSRADTANVRRCLAHGLFMSAAELQPDGTYTALDTHQPVAIHPSSVLFQAKPAYLVFNELLHTSKCYMRDLCLVDADWLHEAAPEYFRRKLRTTKS
ncbi:hypothetical protein JZ751_010758 [Albula glossodonta]|uniref:RNA helicase n=1 Tax=Albula glossodonta TaxID=121402 RepID=A0A8T2MNT0_9TELE|nr:hypothetical protein JZ751_010758 [Albula glossodonta]